MSKTTKTVKYAVKVRNAPESKVIVVHRGCRLDPKDPHPDVPCAVEDFPARGGRSNRSVVRCMAYLKGVSRKDFAREATGYIHDFAKQMKRGRKTRDRARLTGIINEFNCEGEIEDEFVWEDRTRHTAIWNSE